MENSKIEWTDHTANLWWGCQKVHAGCDKCYAEALDGRYHAGNHWGPHSPRLAIKKTFYDLAKFQRDAAKQGVVKRVFVGSMMDIFEKPVKLVNGKGQPIELDDPGSEMYTQDIRETFFHNISRGEYPNLFFLLLTKRPGNINKYIPEAWKMDGAPENVMFGTSVVDQQTALDLVPQLMKVKGKRFLSCEPLIGPIDFENGMHMKDGAKYNPLTLVDDSYPIDGFMGGIHWVIVGGESGHTFDPGIRPMHPGWVMQIKKACNAAHVPFFFKQHGNWIESNLEERPDIGPARRHLWPDGKLMYNVGKKEAGSLLYGSEYKAFPPLHV